MKKEELEKAVDKYIESKELVLMGYPQEYVNDVKEDVKIAFKAGVRAAKDNQIKKVDPIVRRQKYVEDEIIGVKIPIINKSMIFDEISVMEMPWKEAMEHAKSFGKQLPTKEELYILQYFRGQIAALWPAFQTMSFWSQTSSQYSANYAWSVHDYGGVYTYPKYYGLPAIPLSDLILEA